MAGKRSRTSTKSSNAILEMDQNSKKAPVHVQVNQQSTTQLEPSNTADEVDQPYLAKKSKAADKTKKPSPTKHNRTNKNNLCLDETVSLLDNQQADSAPSPMVQNDDALQSNDTQGSSSNKADMLSRFSKLKSMRIESQKLNRKEVHSEFSRHKQTSKESMAHERKLKEAQELQAKTAAEATNTDYDRVKNLTYTIDDVERWEEKLSQKEARKDHGFSDYAQIAAKKYSKMIADIKPDLTKYRQQANIASMTHGSSDGTQEIVSEDAFYRSAHSLSYANHSAAPDELAVDRLVKDIEKQRAQRGQFSRRRAFDDEDEVTYINERNMRFNKKISRAYDKYTADIKANFERGTAL
ncbi:Pre-mRNA-splicing factor SYF2 [Batrachochytrium dendrobatidis]|nr:Pre-mRNA-splicing factor SYF2 [Batrachochytrium dendrobatidis]KAK5673299.1 Pre-mRNA-splicing factor SYF2 [Batrachochytrium dendrobatidis]